jgi:cold shock CspA family protein
MFTIGFKTLSSVRIPAVRSLERSAASRSLSSETGVVKFYVRRKGYGFITRDSTAEDIFVHRTEISGANLDDPNNPELRKGERVKFMIKENDGKSFATKVIMEDGSLVPKTREDVSIKLSSCKAFLF